MTKIDLMTDRFASEGRIPAAAERLALAIMTSPALELVLAAGIVNVIAHSFWNAINHDLLFVPVILGVAIYDGLVAVYMVKTMWLRVRD